MTDDSQASPGESLGAFPAGGRPEEIPTTPETLWQWAGCVALGGMFQAVIVSIIANFLEAFFFPVFGRLFLLPGVFASFSGYLSALLSFVICSVGAGHLFPRFAFWRGGVAFLFATGQDAILVNVLHQPGVFIWEGYEARLILPFTLLGMLVCAWACAFGSHLQRGLGAWIDAEMDEFFDSLGFGTGRGGGGEGEEEDDREDDECEGDGQEGDDNKEGEDEGKTGR
jgi:hypothetical protein